MIRRLSLLFIAFLLLSLIAVLCTFNYTAYQSQVAPSNKLPTLNRQSGATAECNNGKFSYSTAKTACSRNGGIKQRFSPEPSPQPANTTTENTVIVEQDNYYPVYVPTPRTSTSPAPSVQTQANTPAPSTSIVPAEPIATPPPSVCRVPIGSLCLIR